MISHFLHFLFSSNQNKYLFHISFDKKGYLYFLISHLKHLNSIFPPQTKQVDAMAAD